MVIEMARGDVYCVPLALFIDGQPADILMDEVYFTVKKHHYNHEALLQKCISNGGIVPDNEGSYVLTINPEDTDGYHPSASDSGSSDCGWPLDS